MELGERLKRAGQDAGAIANDWITIPRQLKQFAWAMISLAAGFLLLTAMRR